MGYAQIPELIVPGGDLFNTAAPIDIFTLFNSLIDRFRGSSRAVALFERLK